MPDACSLSIAGLEQTNLKRRPRKPRNRFLCFLCFLWSVSSLYGERLPLRSFSSADGLAHDHINQIYPDSQGYLWIGTDEGLSRFDGYEFSSFTTAQGLPHPHVNGIAEAPGQGYWVATDGGLCWFDGKHFKVYRPPGGPESSRINSVAIGNDNTLWLGTDGGLFRMRGNVIETVDAGKLVTLIRFDRTGSLWVPTAEGADRRDQDGSVVHFLKGYINKTFQDGKGRHWILTRTAGFTILDGRSFSTKDGLPSNDVRDVYEVEPGKYWIATPGGLVQMHESAAGVTFRTYTTANGLTDNRIYNLPMQLEISGSGPITPEFKEWRGTVLSPSVLRMEYGSPSSARFPTRQVETCCWLLEITMSAHFIRSMARDFMQCP
jgi:ligand-binding sensor domain-containing protein